MLAREEKPQRYAVQKYIDDVKSVVQVEDWLEGTPQQSTANLDPENPKVYYKMCEYLKNNGTDVNKSDERGSTPLHTAVNLKTDVKELFDLLIKQGANIHKKDNELCTALFFTVKNKNLYLSKKLLELGANPNDVNARNETILEQAFINKDEEMTRLLLSFNAKVNDLNALCVALKTNQLRLLQMLLKCGAHFDKEKWGNPSFRTRFRDSLAEAIRNEHLQVVDCILENCSKAYALFLENGYTNILYKHELNVRNMRRLPSRNVENSLITKNIAIQNEINETPLAASPLYFIDNENDKAYKKEYQKYAHQLKLMKETKVDKNMNYTYFDLLTRRGASLVSCCNEETASAILSHRYERLFPDFTNKLERNIDRGMMERKVKQECVKLLYEIIGHKLGLDIINHICSFLTRSDFNVFVMRRNSVHDLLENIFNLM